MQELHAENITLKQKVTDLEAMLALV